jgi:hypothetical protein
VPYPLPRRIAWVRLSISSPRVQPSPSDRNFRGLLGLHFVAAHRIAQQPKAAFVAGLRPSQVPSRAACQLPDQSTFIRVRPSLTDSSRPRGARSFASFWPSADHFRSSPGNGHRQGGPARPKSANRRHSIRTPHPTRRGVSFPQSLVSAVPPATLALRFLTLAVTAPAHHHWCQFFIAARW